MKILIVDESAAIHHRLKTLLSPIPALEALSHARHAPEALSVLDVFSPHVVIFDLFFSIGTGFDILHLITQRQTPPLAIVLMEHPTAEIRRECLVQGADFVLDKATEIERTVFILQHALQKHSYTS